MTFHVILFIQSIRKKNYKIVCILSFRHLKCVELSGESLTGLMIYQPVHFSHMPTRQQPDFEFAQVVYVLCCCEWIYIIVKNILLLTFKTETKLILISMRNKLRSMTKIFKT